MDNITMQWTLVALVVLVLLLTVWGLNKDQLNRELKKKIIEYGMFHNQSMVYYITQARKNRKLIHKYNALYTALCKVLDVFEPVDRLEWLEENNIKLSDFTIECENDSSDKEVNATVTKANNFVKDKFKKKKI